MKIFKTIDEMRSWSRDQKKDDRRISFVPTMGALHDGHMALLIDGQKRGDSLVLSIYVNPTQFGPTEDLSKYPRTLESDLEIAKRAGCDAVFLPNDEMIYPAGFKTFIEVNGITEKLCGASRPGHFRGVVTVVAKLFNIIDPDIAIFGEKDFQQLAVIKRMVRDLNMSVEIVSHPIVREKDGLAISSRNRYLSQEEREAALSLNRSLGLARDMIAAGECSTDRITSAIKKTIEGSKIPRIDYIEIVNPDTFEDLTELRKPALIAIAAFIGPARLIDNLYLP